MCEETLVTLGPIMCLNRHQDFPVLRPFPAVPLREPGLGPLLCSPGPWGQRWPSQAQGGDFLRWCRFQHVDILRPRRLHLAPRGRFLGLVSHGVFSKELKSSNRHRPEFSRWRTVSEAPEFVGVTTMYSWTFRHLPLSLQSSTSCLTPSVLNSAPTLKSPGQGPEKC